ncbi:MAG: MarR family winged helix-turn-helix transcriptional regulator [Clostridia bacterium]
MSSPMDAGRMIGMISNQIKRQFDDTVSHGTITGVQGRFLHFILSHSPTQDVFQKDLEEEFNLRRSTATCILQLMEKNGLLYRESVDYDARLKKIVVTDKGTQMKGQVMESIRALEAKIKRGIAPADLDVFFRVMEQMSKNLQ